MRKACTPIADGYSPRDSSWWNAGTHGTRKQYKGINSRWRVPGDGQLFEVQFHTQTILDAKEETHWAYEKLRGGVPTPTEQKELEEYQERVTAQVPDSAGRPRHSGPPVGAPNVGEGHLLRDRR